jgi:cytochrome c-type biogenesis protein CcmF
MPMLKEARKWSLWAWLFLTIGIVLGAWWAYEELGWGGYWAWDPVENSSLMPWLIATALLHCFRTYKDRSPIATWTVLLSLATFSLCVFGTYLTRSGLIASVHAFPDPGLSYLFLILIAHIWIISTFLMIKKSLRTNNEPHPSMKNTLLFIFINNWLLVILTFVIFIGTLFPFLSGLFTENKISLKPEYFDKITTPFGLALLLLITVCPHLIRAKLKKNWRTIGAVVIAAVAIGAWIVTKAYTIPCFIICAFGLVNLIVDMIGYEMSFAKRAATSPNARRNFQWYGARIVHVGVVLTFLGLAGAGGYSVEKFAAIVPGETAEIGNFKLEYKQMTAEHGPNFTAVAAEIEVYRDDKMLTTLTPSKAFYGSGKPVSEVSIRRTLGGDLYTALTEADNSTKMINLRMLIKPLINWVWIGSILSVIGAMVVLASLYQKKVVSK